MTRRIKIVVILILLLTTATTGFAEGGHEDHHFDWVGFLGKVFNSTILFGGLIIWLRKPIINLLAQKTLDVKTDIVQREKELEKTSGHLQEIQKRLDKIEEEITDMKQAAEKSGEDEKKRIEELGEKESQRIAALTEAEIANKVENSIRKLKSRIADLTIDHLKKDIETRLDKKAHEKIIEKNIDICGDIIERE